MSFKLQKVVPPALLAVDITKYTFEKVNVLVEPAKTLSEMLNIYVPAEILIEFVFA